MEQGRREGADAGPTVGQLGETRLIGRFAPLLRPGPAEPASPYELLGPGDDCAVVAAPDGRFVISTDTQVQGQDFELHWPSGAESTGFDTGHKCATQNLADAAAMGAVPSSLVVSLALPPATPVRWVEDFARGLRAGVLACGATSCGIVGGDLSASREISVTATVTGDLQGRRPVRRNGAEPGDLVVLAGTVGRAAAGLDLLLSTDYVPGRDAVLDELAGCQLRPVSPVGLGPALARAGATAMIDVSDGLLRDLTRMAEASGIDVALDPQALAELAKPLAAAGRLLVRDPLYWVLNGGEDHGLLSTVPSHVQLPEGVRPLGSVLASPPGQEGAQAGPLGGSDREPAPDRIRIGTTPVHELPARVRGRGWDHFESQEGF
ncbi:thiamine-phosphate kinase [Kocuria coralli]|uniref:Thiamine-monophosphate kinase n=2 Tax=Kocuria coralli TaxID=1461025 RepID=A0A5J5L2I8_9MICC|nr:thiamine-phosphate kinase [Kocuria coralli]